MFGKYTLDRGMEGASCDPSGHTVQALFAKFRVPPNNLCLSRQSPYLLFSAFMIIIAPLLRLVRRAFTTLNAIEGTPYKNRRRMILPAAISDENA